MFERPERGERAILVRIGLGRAPDADELAEFDALARSAGAIPAATITGSRRSPEPRYFIGSGKAEEVRDRAQAEAAELVLVDHELSPSQERNLEKLTGRRVLDRTGLILDIFATRARSAEGKLEWAPVDKGFVDWAAQFSALKAAGYHGAVSLETHWHGGTPEESTRISWAGMKQALDKAGAL